MTEGKGQDLINGAALTVAAIYFYRRLIEPAAGQSVSRDGTIDESGEPREIFSRFRGPKGSLEKGEPRTVTGAAAQLMGDGKPASIERFVVGWGFVFLTLSLANPYSPQLAGSFAALIGLGSVLTNGSQVAADLQTQLRAKPEGSKQTAFTAAASPTTFVSIAGAASTATAPLSMVKSPGPKKKKRTASKSRLDLA